MKRPERLVWLVAGAAFAAAGGLIGVPSVPVMLCAVGVIALFANASVFVRIRALRAAANEQGRNAGKPRD
jgi:hypothetical protein